MILGLNSLIQVLINAPLKVEGSSQLCLSLLGKENVAFL